MIFLRKCITRLDILKLEYNPKFSSIFDSSFFEFESKLELNSNRNWISSNSNFSRFKLEFFEFQLETRTRLKSKLRVENSLLLNFLWDCHLKLARYWPRRIFSRGRNDLRSKLLECGGREEPGTKFTSILTQVY